MSRNLSSVINENFNYVSWVELYNSGPDTIKLSNFVFFDNKEHVWECRSDKKLNPNEFSVIYFDELNTSTHSSFKLDSDGGELSLMNINGTVIDKVEYPKGIRNISYGRIKDGDDNWGNKEKHTFGYSNDKVKIYSKQTKAPEFSLIPGFYNGPQKLIIWGPENVKIYYTIDGAEPQQIEEHLYNDTITIDRNMTIRAVAVADSMLPSDPVTNSYFIDERKMTLPVISLASDPILLFSDSIGMMAKGEESNWTVSANCGEEIPSRGNYMEDWDRPINFEYFDESLSNKINIELKGSISGNCSRQTYPRSLKLKANKTYSETKRINFQFFTDKYDQKTRSILLRNSGNDKLCSYMRDALVHSLLVGQMNIDYQSYKPAIIFLNGKYHGILNIRERSNEDYVYSNYGYEEDEIDFPSQYRLNSVNCYKEVWSLQNSPDVNADGIYARIDSLIDIDEFLNYFMVEIYCGNGDWAGNNMKLWKPQNNGKWRWILFDTDFGMGLMNQPSHYTFDNADKFDTFKKLIKNKKLSEKFITKNMIHMATTFSPQRVGHFIDSLSSNIKEEIGFFYDYVKTNKLAPNVYNWEYHVKKIRTYADNRPSYQFFNLKKYFNLGDTASFTITSNSNVKYMLNDEPVYVSTLKTRCYIGFPVSIIPIDQSNKVFSHWEVTKKGEGTSKTYKDSSFVLKDTFSMATTYKAVFRDKQLEDYRPCEFLRVNEICIINNVNEDEYGDLSDWIEIYNSSDQAVSLAGLYISDNKNDLKKYQFPSDLSKEDSAMLMIPPKSYKIVWADTRSDKGPLHVNFSLSQKERETVSLSYGNYGFVNVIDSVSYDIHKIGESYAYFVRNGVPVWKTTSNYTFDGKNQIELVCPSDSLTKKVYDGISLMPEAKVIGEYPGDEVVLKYSYGMDDIWCDTAPSLSDVDSMTVKVKAIHSSYEVEECQYVLSIVDAPRNEDVTDISNFLSYEESKDLSDDVYRVYDLNGKLIRTAKNKIDLFQNLSGTYLICKYRNGRLVSIYRYLTEK